jgi:hypothetical protein
VSTFFSNTFDLLVGHGHLARGSVFAMMLRASEIACHGDDSPEAAKAKDMIRDLQKHRLVQLSTMWTRSPKDLPRQHASDDDFEKWVWRREGN